MRHCGPAKVADAAASTTQEDLPRLQRWVDSVEEWFGGAESKPLIERCRDCQACLREYTAYAKERAATLRHENEARGGGAAAGGGGDAPTGGSGSGGSDGGGVAAGGGDGGGRGGGGGGGAVARPVLLELLACVELPEGDLSRLSEAAAYATAFFLLCATYEATAALIGATLLSLLHNPRALATVRGQHASDKAVHAAVSEALRYCSPIKATRREVRSDLALASGETLQRGDSVSFVHAALNLDDETFSHPTRCDVAQSATSCTYAATSCAHAVTPCAQVRRGAPRHRAAPSRWFRAGRAPLSRLAARPRRGVRGRAGRAARVSAPPPRARLHARVEAARLAPLPHRTARVRLIAPIKHCFPESLKSANDSRVHFHRQSIKVK